ncbi:UDP-glucose 4-epimerase GalE [Antiquaquibacter oligotrophicus]|nr:UDP-glucose 4-epimerase GalE [Antiquaquibacter oligotrophicus]UDF12594.1 UDP-glucose 4-epimerase GalE [Antiquaquibacter oligotrophicus]
MGSLVVGGAGYIGSHLVHLLRERGDDVWIVDDLSTGIRDRIDGAQFVGLDITAPDAERTLTHLMADHGLDTVFQFAALKSVEESVSHPLRYYDVNVHGLLTVLAASTAAGVERFVLSSSAAVYGDTGSEPVTEDDATTPLSPYGRSKLMGESIVRDVVAASGMTAASLRYFNVAGAATPQLADRGSSNLVPRVLHCIAKGDAPEINGDDYDTPDGTCVRDYIDVVDLASAHLYVSEHLPGNPGSYSTFNVGTGVGISVREVVDRAIAITGADVEPVVLPRRAGDPATVVADSSRLHRLGWTAGRGLDDMIASTWAAFRAV